METLDLDQTAELTVKNDEMKKAYCGYCKAEILPWRFYCDGFCENEHLLEKGLNHANA